MKKREHVKVATVILAGGAGNRMNGQDKGWVLFQDKPLIGHILTRLLEQSQSSTQILISANRNIKAYEALGYGVFSDQGMAEKQKFDGPLAGMISCLPYLAKSIQRVQFMACDVPFIPLNLVKVLAQTADSAYPYTDAYPHYCHVQCNVSDLNLIPHLLAQGEHRIGEFIKQIQAQAVLFEDDAAFLNCNYMANSIDRACK